MKPFRSPSKLANFVLTNLLGNWDYGIQVDWEADAQSIAAALAGCRLMEEQEMVNLELGVVIDA